MRDSEIRSALKARLLCRHAGEVNFELVDELEVCHGQARADLAVANGRLEGYEIKSDCDSLARLTRQAEMYGHVFDRMTLVCGQRHLDKALAAVPSWWAVVVATSANDGVVLRTVRRGRANPGRSAQHIVTLLDRQQTLSLLAQRGLDRGIRSKSIDLLRDTCAAQVPLRVLRAAARDAVRARAAWRLVPSST